MTLGIVVILLAAMTVHEVGHGLVANWLGDDTAKREGRLTLNPLRHIDPFWTLLLPAMLYFATGGRFMIGMAKPVPVNFLKLENPRRDMIWVALAGSFVNLVLAGVLAFFYKFANNEILLYGVYLNLGLACFNMIPLPPLDGSRVLGGLLPRAWVPWYFGLERFGILLIVILYFSGLLIPWVILGVNFFCSLMGIPYLSQRIA
ncbi:MAG: site-2 protease family protein [Candidatus Omnitrophica bacterium]|nr:site-2 protease family protein [Candidatus Omnitrophota bacterium]